MPEYQKKSRSFFSSCINENTNLGRIRVALRIHQNVHETEQIPEQVAVNFAIHFPHLRSSFGVFGWIRIDCGYFFMMDVRSSVGKGQDTK